MTSASLCRSRSPSTSRSSARCWSRHRRLLRCGRRSWSPCWWPGSSSCLPPFEAFQALFFIWCVEALAGRIRLPVTTLAAIGGVARRCGRARQGQRRDLRGRDGGRHRRLDQPPPVEADGVFMVATLASGLGLWLATGQQLDDLGAYASAASTRSSRATTRRSASDSSSKRRWIYLASPALAAILVWTRLAEQPRLAAGDAGSVSRSWAS